MTSLEEQISQELGRFSDNAARARFERIRVPPHSFSFEDVYGKKHEVLTIAEAGTVQIVFRPAHGTYPWGIFSKDFPVADFNWYQTLWDVFLAAGLWPLPPDYVFD